MAEAAGVLASTPLAVKMASASCTFASLSALWSGDACANHPNKGMMARMIRRASNTRVSACTHLTCIARKAVLLQFCQRSPGSRPARGRIQRAWVGR